jgi:hypothetical protein
MAAAPEEHAEISVAFVGFAQLSEDPAIRGGQVEVDRKPQQPKSTRSKNGRRSGRFDLPREKRRMPGASRMSR